MSWSEQITDARCPTAASTPRLAEYPVVNSSAASAPRQAARRASKREWTGREPTISRADPDPAPYSSTAAAAAAFTPGCWESPR